MYPIPPALSSLDEAERRDRDGFYQDHTSALPYDSASLPLGFQPRPVYWPDDPDPFLLAAAPTHSAMLPHNAQAGQYTNPAFSHQNRHFISDSNGYASLYEFIPTPPFSGVPPNASQDEVAHLPTRFAPSSDGFDVTSVDRPRHSDIESSHTTGNAIEQLLSIVSNLKDGGELAETDSLKLQLLEKDLLIAQLRKRLQEGERSQRRPKATLPRNTTLNFNPHRPLQSSMSHAIPQLNTQRVSKSRAAFTDMRRKETAMTRRIGACFYCRKRKERCTTSPLDPTGQCMACAALNVSIHRIPCLRTRIPQVSIFRTQTTEKDTWTLRPEIYRTSELSTVLYANVRVIEITQDAGEPLSVSVSEFIPVEGDETSYKWEFDGVEIELPMPCFAITNVLETKAALESYIVKNTNSFVEHFTAKSSKLVWNTFQMATKKARYGKSPLLQKLLSLWVTSRLIEEPWRICSEETLGVTLEDTVGTPYQGKIPVPPVMDSQFDQIIIQSILKPLRAEVLRMLDVKISRAKKEDWFETYLSVFLLLNNIEIATAHDHEFATFHGHVTPGRGSRFEDYKLVESYFHGAQVIIAHFRDAIGGHLPFQPNWAGQMTSLDEEEMEYLTVMRSELSRLRSSLISLRANHKYESMLYWCHQLFYGTWDSSQVIIRELEDGEEDIDSDTTLDTAFVGSAN